MPLGTFSTNVSVRSWNVLLSDVRSASEIGKMIRLNVSTGRVPMSTVPIDAVTPSEGIAADRLSEPRHHWGWGEGTRKSNTRKPFAPMGPDRRALSIWVHG